MIISGQFEALQVPEKPSKGLGFSQTKEMVTHQDIENFRK
jgi:hypothetical protein